MRANTLEDVVPGLREARNRERLNRTLAFSEVPWTVMGRQVVVLTPRHRLELQAVGNAFSTGGTTPNKADVFQILWRLNPAFTPRPLFLSRAWRAREATAWAVRRADLHDAQIAILDYLASMLQDLPESSGTRDSSNPPEDYVHWMASEMNFYLKRYNGFTRQIYMDTPYLVLQGLYRAHRLEIEDHPNFVNESDRLIAAWHRLNTPARANN